MAQGYGAMMGKGGGNAPPKPKKPMPPGMGMGANSEAEPTESLNSESGMGEDDDGEDMMMGDEYSEEQRSLAQDAITAAKSDDADGFLRAVHAIMDSYETPTKPGMQKPGMMG